MKAKLAAAAAALTFAATTAAGAAQPPTSGTIELASATNRTTCQIVGDDYGWAGGAICHTGWVDEGDLDNDLNVAVPDELGSQHYYMAGWRVGWVQRHHSMPVWIANWRENKPGIVYQLTWLDPYAGDSAGHIFPTIEQAKAKVETAFELRLEAK